MELQSGGITPAELTVTELSTAQPDPTLQELARYRLDPSPRPVIPERAIRGWLREAIKNHTPHEGVSIHLGCRGGDWLTSIMSLTPHVIAVDTSETLLSDASRVSGLPVLRPEAVEVAHFASQPLDHGPLLVNATPGNISSRLEPLRGHVDSVFAPFAASMLPSPEMLFDTIHPLLKDGGTIIYAGNVFVRPADFESSSISRAIINRGAIPHQQICERNSLFDHLLLTLEGPIRSREFVHDLGMFARAMESGRWDLVDVQVSHAEGCQHVAPESEEQQPSNLLLKPNAALEYQKIGIVARKISSPA